METRDGGLVKPVKTSPCSRKYLHFSISCTKKENFPKEKKRFSAVKHGLEIIGQQREMIDLMCAIKCEFIAKKEDVWCVQALHSIDFYDVRKFENVQLGCVV